MEMLQTVNQKERIVLVGILNSRQDQAAIEEYLDELAFLTETAGAITVRRFTQRIERPDPRTYIGSGKVTEIKTWCEEHAIDGIIFDDELSPSQQRNLEKALGKKVLDRNLLILDIFAGRARTAHAKAQVQLAQYEYLLPRLTGMWTHLDRVKGGIGMKGAGEKEIETDRRIIRDKISQLKHELKDIDRVMATQRKNRGEMIRVALVGYTNVGKSTMMNLLSKSTVFAENKLFATLDTTVRKVVVGNLPFLLSDTVGFIRKLPTLLVESFKSTLDEVREADLLMHVVDISHPNFEEHINVVNQTLADIGAANKSTILVFNKIDAYREPPEVEHEYELDPSARTPLTLEEMKRSWMSKLNDPCIFISATDKENIDELRNMLYERVKELHVKRYPYNSFLY